MARLAEVEGKDGQLSRLGPISSVLGSFRHCIPASSASGPVKGADSIVLLVSSGGAAVAVAAAKAVGVAVAVAE